ncbi:mechanosensitive ion channel family protein [Deferribacterales bacterium Es71-Z0220]|uniref:mechanosensitive ion channel family protein n=1 Tax=Deferrivibrio essentukiensis TaxID=2880922 RepID=UPI001F5FFC0E|nr:mechanosensitive ion channel family protein [Deferrivibrio essentukiensis]MCB4203408.1 mechanosensitive ion channel family protein [Deferrivibrio essentukiensis]
MNNKLPFIGITLGDVLTRENIFLALSLAGIIFLTLLIFIYLKILAKRGKVSVNFAKLVKYVAIITVSEFIIYFYKDFPPVIKFSKGVEIIAFGIFVKIIVVDIYYLEIIKKKTSKTSHIIADILKFAIIAVFLLYFLRSVFEFNLAAILTPSAILTAIIGLSMQDTIGNLISGLIIQLEKPFEIGDWIEIDSILGEVVEINWRYTKIKNLQDIYIILPNNNLAKDKVINYTKPTPEINQMITIGVSYSASPILVKSAISEVVKSNPNTKLINIFLKEYSDSSIVYEIYYTVKGIGNLRKTKDEIYSGIWYNFKNKGIEIPFPIRTVIMKKEEEGPVINTELINKLKASDIFSEISESVLIDFLSYGLIKEYLENEEVIKEGESGESMFFVLEGKFEAKKHGKNLGILQPGDFFGEMSLLTGDKRYATITAVTKAKAIEIDRQAFKVLLQRERKVIDKVRSVIESRSKGNEANNPTRGSKKTNYAGVFEKFKKIFSIS